MSRANRRVDERVKILGDLQREVAMCQPQTITEISDGGAQIETSFPLALGSLHDLRLTLGPASIVVQGRVAHARVIGVELQQVVYESGIEFVDPSEQVRTAVSAFVASLRTTQGLTRLPSRRQQAGGAGLSAVALAQAAGLRQTWGSTAE